MYRHMLTIFLVVMTASNLVLAQGTGKSGAKLFAGETAFDFGFIPAGGVVSHSYTLHSRGTDSLRILKVQPACGCTKAPIKKESVAVGDSTDVELVFTSNKGASGSVSKSATVSCNDADRATFQLTFKGVNYSNPDSLTPLTISTAELAFDEKSRAKEAKLIVKNVSENIVKMHLVSTSAGYFRVEVPTSEIKPGGEKEINVRINTGIDEGQFKKSFTFAVDDQAGTRYTIPVSYNKSAEVSVFQPAGSKVAADGK